MSVPDNDVFENGFKTQWEQFLRHVVEDAAARVRLARRARAACCWPRRAWRARAPARGSTCPSSPSPELAASGAPMSRRRPSSTPTAARSSGPSCPTRPPSTGRPRPLRSRVAYAAAHVVPRVGAENVPGAPADIDWDATLAFRHHVWSWGLGVADAMDTAQRNMGLDAKATRELIARSAAEARAAGGALVVGVNTDHVDEEAISLQAVIDAYVEQLHFAEDQGAGTVLMASRHLARAATSPADYAPRLPRGARARRAPRSCCTGWAPRSTPSSRATSARRTSPTGIDMVVADHRRERRAGCAGIKMSLLDAEPEIAVRVAAAGGRARCSPATTSTTSASSRATAQRHSDALLGAFAAIAPNASAAIQALDAGDPADYRRILGPPRSWPGRSSPRRPSTTRPASRSCPGSTATSRRSAWSAACTRRAACRTCPRSCGWPTRPGALEHPELAAERWNAYLALHGVETRASAGRRHDRAPAAVDQPGDDQVRRPRRPRCASPPRRASRASGCGASRWPRSGSPTAAAHGRRLRAALLDAVPRRVLHRSRRRPAAGPRSTTTAGRSRRPRRSPRRAPPAPAPVLVLVAGGLPEGDRDLLGARARVRDAIGELVDDAAAAGVMLAIEPLHPMYASDRGVVSTLGQALDIAEQFPAAAVGVVVDTFHVWWDPQLCRPDRRAGRSGRIASYQVCDWMTPLPPTSCSRAARPGRRGHRLRRGHRAVVEAGYAGDIEVEIFNQAIWDADPAEVAPAPPRPSTPTSGYERHGSRRNAHHGQRRTAAGQRTGSHPLRARASKSLSGRGGANVERATVLNGPELTRTARNCTVTTCVESVSPCQDALRAELAVKGSGVRIPSAPLLR